MNNKSPRSQRGSARVKLPQRHQKAFDEFSLDEMVRENDLVRTVVRYADSLDLSDLYEPIKATSNNVGRDAIDPRMLFCLWLFATLEGVSSGRRIAKLTKRDIAYRWICGGVSINYHTLCDFRSQHSDFLERILTESITVLQNNGLIELRSIAQDGMRVRASAGSGSFRRQGKLEESLELAKEFFEQVTSTDDEVDDDDGPKPTVAQASARKRAAAEKVERLEEALVEMEDMQARYAKRNERFSAKHQRSEPRASKTDPESRRMKMGDGGTRPAFNVQFSSDVDTLVVVGVDVASEGSDAGLLQPMYDHLRSNYQVTPEVYMADGGFSKKQAVTYVERQGTKFYGPLYNEKKMLEAGEDPYSPKPKDNKIYSAFRARMGTEEAKAIYRKRACAAEFPNATCRNQGLKQFSVRGIVKAKAQALLHVLAGNMKRFLNLKDEKSGLNYLEVLMAS